MKDLFLRTKQIASYMLATNSTIRKTAKVFGMAKSTVHYDLTKRLPYIDASLYAKVRHLLNQNFDEKSVRGGVATKQKYAMIKCMRSNKH